MPEILAVAAEDGWAFVKQDGRIFLVRPPYAQTGATEVPASAVERAVSAHGFQATARSFDSWGKLIEHLERTIVDAAAGRPRIEDAARKLLRHASRETVVRFIDRIASELVPSQKWEEAATALEALLDLEVVSADQDLRHRAVDLLKACTKGLRGSHEQLLRETLNVQKWSPLAVLAYGEERLRRYVEEVQRGNALLSMG
jgi:hypothetical protein